MLLDKHVIFVHLCKYDEFVTQEMMVFCKNPFFDLKFFLSRDKFSFILVNYILQ